MWTFLLLTLTAAAPDASVPDPPLGPEHRALTTQVEALRQKVKALRPADSAAARLKTDLADLEEVLAQADELQGERVAVCQAPYLRLAGRRPGAGMMPGFFQCLSTVQVDDETVRALRRRMELRNTLKRGAVAAVQRQAVVKELEQLDAQVDKARGLEPLRLEAIPRVEFAPDDAGMLYIR